jgi:uncharacterized protein (UPF0335 family)
MNNQKLLKRVNQQLKKIQSHLDAHNKDDHRLCKNIEQCTKLDLAHLKKRQQILQKYRDTLLTRIKNIEQGFNPSQNTKIKSTFEQHGHNAYKPFFRKLATKDQTTKEQFFNELNEAKTASEQKAVITNHLRTKRVRF